MAKPLPEWAQPGADVAIYYTPSFADPIMRMTTIARTTATQIVTADGTKWTDKSRIEEPNIRQVGTDVYRSPILLPASDPRVAAADALAVLRSAEAALGSAYEALQRDRRNAHLARVLADKAESYAKALETRNG